MRWYHNASIGFYKDVDMCVEGDCIIYSYYLGDEWIISVNYMSHSGFCCIRFNHMGESFRDTLKEFMMDAVDRKGLGDFKDSININSGTELTIDISLFIETIFEKGGEYGMDSQ